MESTESTVLMEQLAQLDRLVLPEPTELTERLVQRVRLALPAHLPFLSTARPLTIMLAMLVSERRTPPTSCQWLEAPTSASQYSLQSLAHPAAMAIVCPYS